MLNDGPVRNTLRLDISQTDSNGYVDREERSAFTSALSLRTDFSEQLSHTLALEYQNEQVDMAPVIPELTLTFIVNLCGISICI